ncbi:MAG TPA: Hpt domain-containing protein [Gemmatimonadales bacterium]|nr:Hpt domain-containing protein [Gemmatimonadales bacterium]
MKGRSVPAADLADMLEALGHDRRAFQQLIELFLKNTPALLTELRSGAEHHDRRRVQSAAHRLRGSVAQFSRGEASEALREVERLAESGDLGLIRQELGRAERGLTALIRAMRPYRARTRTPRDKGGRHEPP